MITINEFQITGTQEDLIRDNVVNPDTELVVRALQLLMQPYQAATLSRAKSKYQAAYQANPEDVTLPNFLNDNAVTNWYLSQEDYQDATQKVEASRVANLTSRITQLTTQLDHLNNQKIGAGQDVLTTLNASIAGIEAEIENLTSSI